MALARSKKILLLAAQQNANMEIQENKNTVSEDVCDKTKNFIAEDAATEGCSKWITVPQSETSSDIKLRLCRLNKNPLKTNNSFSGDLSYEEDVDDSDRDPDFTYSSTDSSDVENRNSKGLDELELSNDEMEDEIAIKKGKKKRAKPQLWKKNNKKICRNFGKKYTSNSKNPRLIRERNLQQPCSDSCKLKCYEKISHQLRETIFKNYWELGSLQLQREFISKLVTEVKPKYRYERVGSTRSFNHAFHFIVNGLNIRVCKKFFKATLDINDRPIRTVLRKSNDGFVEADKRGKHGNHKVIDPTIRQGIHDFINSIPRIESHYLREQTTREYIDGGKSIAGMHRDYVEKSKRKNENYGNLTLFSRIFNEEFNISFFVPKKDQCELCTAYNNVANDEKEKLKDQYDNHLKEKKLSREEKKKDKLCAETNDKLVVAVYDLQAVLPAPKGDVSVFFYKSKINSYNLTVSDLKLDDVQCYFWHEAEGNRGSIEIGTCVYKYLEQISQKKNDKDLEIVLYSDNCCGQQKNSFIFGMYLFAIQKLNIKSITHKFLIKGHTQNEGDNSHSVIEKAVKKALKSGPIYTPPEYVRIIRSAKKTGNAFKVIELSHTDFIDWKFVTKQLGSNFNKVVQEKDESAPDKVQNETEDEQNSAQNNESIDTEEEEDVDRTTQAKRVTKDKKIIETIKMGDIKLLKVLKSEPRVIFVKTSYEQEEFKKIKVNDIKLKRGEKKKKTIEIEKIICPPAYKSRIPVTQRKKSDILDLIKGNYIPKFYGPFYDSILNT